MRSLVTLIALALPAALVAMPVAAAEQDFSKVQIETIPLAPGLAMLIGSGGNIVVSTGKDGPVIVDDQFAPLASKITAAVNALQNAAQNAVQNAPIRFVINTHHHFDHTGGNEPFGNAGA